MKSQLKYVILLVLIAVASSNVSAIETAEQVMARCADKISNAPSVTLKFVLSFGENKSNCELIIARDKYRLSSHDIEVWFDGKTQWSYSAQDKEISITEPTFEEQMECNPFAILNNYKSAYTIRRLSGNKHEIELVAKNKMSNIRKAVVTIDNKSYMPTKLIVTLANGRTFSATVTSATEGKSMPVATFIYNKEKYPAKAIVDLR